VVALDNRAYVTPIGEKRLKLAVFPVLREELHFRGTLGRIRVPVDEPAVTP
jgi:hypothetical protein